MRTNGRFHRRAAFTLIELVVTITVVAVVAGLGTGILVEAGRAYTRSKTLTENYADGDYALRRLAEELGDVAAATDLTSIGAGAVTFSLSGQEHTFVKSGTDLLRDGKALASGVSAFTLTYYDSSGAVTAVPASVHRVAAEITIDRNGAACSLRTEVFPRGLRTSYTSWEVE